MDSAYSKHQKEMLQKNQTPEKTIPQFIRHRSINTSETIPDTHSSSHRLWNFYLWICHPISA